MSLLSPIRRRIGSADPAGTATPASPAGTGAPATAGTDPPATTGGVAASATPAGQAAGNGEPPGVAHAPSAAVKALPAREDDPPEPPAAPAGAAVKALPAREDDPPEPPAAPAGAPSAAVTGDRRSAPRAGSGGLLRSARLFRLFLDEQTEPERFYTGLAEDAVRQVEDYGDLAGRTIVDVGGGAGYFTAAFRARGARCYLFEPDPGEMASRGENPGGAVVADGYWLPVRDGGADVCFSSNVLEHVSDPAGLIDEMVRATRPGGLIYLSYTNWYSPWGGHETSPWHYLGPRFAERRYTKRHQRPPKNQFGVSLFPLHVGPVLRLVRSRDDIEIVDARPRYYPRWCRIILRVPVLREIATWNLLLILRRKG